MAVRPIIAAIVVEEAGSAPGANTPKKSTSPTRILTIRAARKGAKMRTTEQHRHYRSLALRCVLVLTLLACGLQWAPGAGPDEITDGPKIYVPYKDIGAVVSRTDRALLMDRAEFNKLLASAKAAAVSRVLA